MFQGRIPLPAFYKYKPMAILDMDIEEGEFYLVFDKSDLQYIHELEEYYCLCELVQGVDVLQGAYSLYGEEWYCIPCI